jgi:tetratricopeptide (TPR) repeat protein
MTAKFFKGPAALLVFGLAIFWGAGVPKATYARQQATPPSGSGKQAAPTVNKAEEDAYKAFYAARTSTPATQIQLGEDFIKKFPQSRYLPVIYGRLATDYFSIGDEDKMFAAGTKAIELNPDNVDVLSLMAMAIPRRVQGNTPDAAKQLQNAATYAHHAIDLIPTLPKPPELDDAAFEKAKNEQLSMAHSGLGLIDLNTGKADEARAELMQAVQLASSPDPVDYYLLGNADVQASFYNDAVTAFQKCAASGPLMAQCKTRAESAKKDATTKLGR